MCADVYKNVCLSVFVEWLLTLLLLNLGSEDFWFWVVGRGVLRFGDARYRKPRSNFGGFGQF